MIGIIVILSPTKTLDLEALDSNIESTTPQLLNEAEMVMNVLKNFTSNDLISLMKISKNLAEVNFFRNKEWKKYNGKTEKSCILSYKGEVYKSLMAETFSEEEMKFCNEKFRILSGLYGVLRPLDGIKPYRLEMCTKLSIDSKKNLYDFWRNIISDLIVKEVKLNKDRTLLNLASEEYYKVLSLDNKVNIITPVFKEKKDSEYKIVSMYTKKARGVMANYIIRNRISNVENLKTFKEEGYLFNKDLSNDDTWVYTRG